MKNGGGDSLRKLFMVIVMRSMPAGIISVTCEEPSPIWLVKNCPLLLFPQGPSPLTGFVKNCPHGILANDR
jgi:hypothetical protein